MKNAGVSQALDRLRLNDDQTTMLMGEFIKACDGDITMFSISRSSTKRAWKAQTRRIETPHEISEQFA